MAAATTMGISSGRANEPSTTMTNDEEAPPTNNTARPQPPPKNNHSKKEKSVAQTNKNDSGGANKSVPTQGTLLSLQKKDFHSMKKATAHQETALPNGLASPFRHGNQDFREQHHNDRQDQDIFRGAAASELSKANNESFSDLILASKHFQPQKQQPSSSSQKELWLLMTSSSAQAAGILVSSAETRDKYNRSAFPNGATTRKIHNLEELRDALIYLLPPPSKKEEKTKTLPLYQSFLDEVKRFELFRSVIDHEDDLLNQRVSWIILAQSFLMAAFITSTEKRSFKYITAFVGLATVIVTLPAIIAAGRNIEVQQEVYFQGLESDERCMQLHGHKRNPSNKERQEFEARRAHGHIFPNMAFRSKRSVKILYTVVGLAIVQCGGWCFLLIILLLGW